MIKLLLGNFLFTFIITTNVYAQALENDSLKKFILAKLLLVMALDF
jgi:hypothetical protein